MLKRLFFLLLFSPLYTFSQAPDYKTIPLDSLRLYWDGLVANRDAGNALIVSDVLLERSKVAYGANDTAYAQDLDAVGMFYTQIKKMDIALVRTKEALSIREKVHGKNSYPAMANWCNLGVVYTELRNAEEGFAAFNHCLDIIDFFEKEETKEVAKVYSSLGNLYRVTGQYQEALKWLTKGLALHHKYEGVESVIYGVTLNNLAGAYYGLGQFEEVLALMQEVKSIRERTIGKEDPRYASTLNNMALVYGKLTRYKEALELYKEAKVIREKTWGKMHPGYAGLLTNMGNAYMQMGEPKLALPFYIESVEIRKAVQPNHPKYAISLSNLGSAYHLAKEFKKASLCFLEVKSIHEKNGHERHPDYAILLSSLSKLYQDLEAFEMAEKLLDEALAILTKNFGPKHYLVSEVLASFSEYFIKKKEWGKAYDFAQKALLANCITIDSIVPDAAFLDQLGNADYFSIQALFPPLTVMLSAQEEQFKLDKDISKMKKALDICQMTIALIERFNNEMSNSQDQLFLLEKNIQFVSFGIFACEVLYLDNPKEKSKYTEIIFQLMEKNKSILLADAVKSNDAHTFGNLPDSLHQKEAQLTAQFDDISRKLMESSSEEEKALFRSDLNYVHQEVGFFKENLKKNYPDYYRMRYANSKMTTPAIQEQMDDKSLLIEYFINDAVVYVFTISKSECQHYTLDIPKKELDQQIQKLRVSLSDYAFITKEAHKAFNHYSESAYWFYQKILEPVLKDKQINSLMIVADGELGHLPFETFLTEAVSSNKGNYDYSKLPYLIKDYKISYNYSAALWEENKSNANTSTNKQILAIAPSYESGQEQDSTQNGMSTTRGPFLERLRKSLNELPAAIAEVHALGELFEGQFVTGAAATEAFFKKEKDNYAVIHLAMHGILNDKAPLLSGLVFTEDKDSIENNYLQAYEISNMKLDADLVVLSACETGYGKFQQGEGVLSLARSFMYAGVPSMVVSLWQVNDLSTSIIMKQFYSNLAEGMDQAKALQDAKLYYIKGAKDLAAHPVFWSPFIQLGVNKPIRIDAQGGWLPWLLGGTIFLFLGLGWMIRKKQNA